MIDNDVKATGLKQLQGIIWKSGFHSGEMIGASESKHDCNSRYQNQYSE